MKNVYRLALLPLLLALPGCVIGTAYPPLQPFPPSFPRSFPPPGEVPYGAAPSYPPGRPLPLVPPPSIAENGDDRPLTAPLAPPQGQAAPSRPVDPAPRPPENEIELPPIRR